MATKRKTANLPVYPGPSWHEIETMSERQIDNLLTKHGVEHRPIRDRSDEELAQWYSASLSEGGCRLLNEVNKDELSKWRVAHNTHRLNCKRHDLFMGLVRAWVSTLSVTKQWQIVEADEGQPPSVQDKRYTNVKDEAFISRVAGAVWRMEMKKKRKEVGKNESSE